MTTTLEVTRIAQVLQPVEDELLRATGGAGIQWYGRAATALYRAFQLAKHVRPESRDAEVILPSISCATPANTALLAGLRPRFADIDPATGMPTLAAIQERWNPNTRAVVFIHLFGQTAEVKPLADWCRARGILLIEDLAQALGASLPDGSSAGSVGDLAIYSFNPTKILECGGGALLIRSRQLVEAVLQLEESDPIPAGINEAQASALALSYRNLHHSLVALLRTRAASEVSSAFLKLQSSYRPLYLRSMKDPEKLMRAWTQLNNVLEHRLQNAEEYERNLQEGDWKLLDQWRQSGVCWRYSLLVNFPHQVVDFSDAVRRDGFHVSNLYWPVNDFFLPGDVCPNADHFARRIINLWVDNSVDPKWVHRCASSLLKNQPKTM